MFKPSTIILYVEDVEKSTEFYQNFLARAPVERFEGFSVFALTDDFSLGLQDRYSIDPQPTMHNGGTEISMSYATNTEVDDLYRQCCHDNTTIALPPTKLEFGYTFVALDPDGHRLRVCATDTTNVK
ncbi:VOC family protein [Bartonella sp. LJL80]